MVGKSDFQLFQPINGISKLHFVASTSAKRLIMYGGDTNQKQKQMFRSVSFDVSSGSAPLPSRSKTKAE